MVTPTRVLRHDTAVNPRNEILFTGSPGLPESYSVRWLARSPVPPIVLLLVAATLLCGFWIWWAYAYGLMDKIAAGREESIVLRANFTGLLLVCLLPVMRYYLSRWTSEDARQLQRDHGIGLPEPQRPGLGRTLGALGAVAFPYLFLFAPTPEAFSESPRNWSLAFILPLVFLPLMGWHMARFSQDLIVATALFGRLGARLPTIDVLAPHTLRPFATQGVRASLLVVVLLSVSANLYLDPGDAVVGSTLVTSMLVVIGLLVLLVPALPVHRRIKEAKYSELARVRAEVRSQRNALAAGATDTSLGDWLALEQRLMAVSEWPYDVGSVTRVSLYVLLGVGSWVGGALVERLLDTSL